ncbi:hypothetical protein D3C78_1708580 [compost metagenome]
MMISSETRPPASMTFLASIPNGVPAFTAARSMSPVEIWGMPKCWVRNAAWVPLPAPGGPSKMRRMSAPDGVYFL